MNAVIPPIEKRAWHYKQEKVKSVRIAHLRNGVMKLLAIILPLMAVTLFVADRLGRSDLFQIDQIEYQGSFQYVDPNEMDVVTKEALTGNFFTIDLLAVQRAVMGISWVKSVHLGREWPNKIVIAIDEYEPIMRWASGGLVMQNGVLVKTSVDALENAAELKTLPILDGGAADLPEMMAKYALWQYELSALGITIEQLSFSDSNAWTLSLLNADVEKFNLQLGSINSDARFNRFVRLFSQGENYFKHLEYIDARYPNGVVVKRKPLKVDEANSDEGETGA